LSYSYIFQNKKRCGEKGIVDKLMLNVMPTE
jgi:hypothetical protein